MKHLWILVLVIGLTMAGCAHKTGHSCGVSDKATAPAGMTGEMKHNHEGPCTDACKAEMMEAHHKHEGPCTDACKAPAPEDTSEESAGAEEKG